MRRAVVLSALGLLLLLGSARFPVPIYRDHTFLHFPVWEVAAQSEGLFFPLSNPYLNHGAPLASDPNHLLLYPTAWLLKFLTAQQAYSIHFFGHALLSFWLMAFLLMGRFDRTKALVLAAFWALSGPFLSASSSLNMFTAFCWVPGIMLAAQRASVLGQVLTLSMAALAGEPVIGLGAAALALVYSPNRKRTLISLGVAALLFLPFFFFLREAFAYSTRMMGGQTWRTALNASLNPVRLPESLLPFLFGVPGTRAGWASFVNPKDFLLPSLGMLWLAFALFEGKRRDWIVLGGLLFLALSSSNPLVALLYKGIPQLAWLRFPEKFFLLAAFLVCWRATDRPLKFHWLPWTGLLAVPAFLLAPAAGALILLSWGTLWLWGSGLPRWALAPGLAFGLTMAFFTVPISSDLFSFQKPERDLYLLLRDFGWVHDLRNPSSIPSEIRERYRTDRMMMGVIVEPPIKELYYVARRLMLCPTGMGLRVPYAFVQDVSGSGLIYYAGVSALASNQPKIAQAYEAIFTFKDYTWPPDMHHLPWLFYYSWKCYPKAGELLEALEEGDYDPQTQVLLSGSCDPIDHPICREIVRTETSNRFQIESDVDIYYVPRESWSPLKHFKIDGTEFPALLAFGALMALKIPAGSHMVELVEPYPLTIQIFLALFYAMLLTEILWSLKSSFRPTTNPGA